MSHFQGMLYGRLQLLFDCQLLKHAARFSLQIKKNKVQKLVCEKFLQRSATLVTQIVCEHLQYGYL